MDLNLLQWNARSALPKKHDFLHLINLYNPAIFAISETWLLPHLPFHIPGYSTYRDDRDDGYGGAAILVNNVFPSSSLSLPPHGAEINAIGVNIIGINFISIYFPPSVPICIPFLRNLCILLNPIILMGDFNCHHFLWGSDHCDASGTYLAELIDEIGLYVLNDGSATRLPRPGQSRSCVDLTLCSSTLVNSLDWKRLNLTYGSDHYPICSTFSNRSLPSKNRTPLLQYRITDARWDIYQQNLDKRILSFPQISFDNLDACLSLYSDSISAAADLSIPLKNSALGKLSSPPWWDRECTDLIKSRKEAEFNYIKNMTLSNLREFNRIVAKSKRTFKKKKYESWKKFCSSLSPSSPSSLVWQNYKKFRRGCFPQNSPNISRSIALQFINRLAPAYAPLVDECPSLAINMLAVDPLDEPFSINELNSVLKYVQDSSPGLDGFPYSFYKMSGQHSRQFLLNLINTCFNFGYIPDAWKSQLIIPILKPGKSPDNPDHYRPIALSPVIGKILEHLIKNRLEWYVESKGMIADSQFGFRKGFSTLDSIGTFISDTRIAFSENQSVVACFLDISSAYDNVLLSVLRSKLRELSVPVKIQRCICNFLAGRTVSVHIPGDLVHTSRLLWRGLPQGSVLSPLLYNIYTSDLHRSLNIGCHILQYADDLCIYTAVPSIVDAGISMQISLNSLNHWLSAHGLQLSASKSSVVVFSRKRVIPDVHLEIEGSPIKVEDNVKFLGVVLDSRLSGIAHFNYTISKCERNINMLRALAGVWWGAHPITLKLIYNATIRSLLDYGSFLLDPCNKTALAKLDAIHSKSLRIILGCMKSSPSNALQVESADPPLILRRQYLADRFIIKAYFHKNHMILPKLIHLDRLYGNVDYWKYKDPPLILNSFRKIRMIEERTHVQQCNRFPMYDSPIEVLSFIPNYIASIDLDKETVEANTQFLSIVESRWRDYHRFFTDASKLSSHSGTGVSVYYQNSNIFLQFRCPPETSVFSGECIGILEACQFVFSHSTITRAVIFSDSGSALDAIVKNPFRDKLHSSIISEIKNCLFSCSKKQIDIILVWIPGHSGIRGNEIADSLAKAAISSSLADLKHHSVQTYDLLHLAKSNLSKSWQAYWTESSKTKGGLYASIQPTVPTKPWFFKFKKISKPVISVLCRVRLGHCCSPVFLHKIRIRDNSLCECGLDDGSIDHIFLNCRLNNSLIWDQVISELKIQRPVNVRHLLSLFPDSRIINAFIKFITTNSIKL